MSADKIRPTKKQYELLAFIKEFADTNGYSPSYREVMRGCNYTSVATVALHINNLIKRGHLTKRPNSARSLEVAEELISSLPLANAKVDAEKSKWLFDHIETRFKLVEENFDQNIVNELYVLVGAAKVLGFEEVSSAFIHRLRQLGGVSS
jgi:SOS-response transcriptional repressor LexA